MPHFVYEENGRVRIIRSGDTNQYKDSKYILLTSLPTVEEKYLKIVSGAVKEMTKTEKDKVDAAEQKIIDDNEAVVISAKTKLIADGYTSDEADKILGG